MQMFCEVSTDDVQTALKAARENENRWMEVSLDFSTDAERMEHWSSTAKLRRIEALLASAVERCSLAHPVQSLN
jgi:hypothetical protein